MTLSIYLIAEIIVATCFAMAMAGNIIYENRSTIAKFGSKYLDAACREYSKVAQASGAFDERDLRTDCSDPELSA